MRPWLLGNTTVRSPFRLADALVVLSKSSLLGNLRGEAQERAFRKLLGESKIVELGDDESYSVGRKWRSALNKLGFLYPPVPGISQDEIGPIDTISPNGERLIRASVANNIPAMQKCFLRALAAHYISSDLDGKDSYPIFSPLRHTLAIMLNLEKQTGESRLNFIEMAIIVQLTSNKETIASIVAQVLILRERRKNSSNKRKFDRQERESAGLLYRYVESTFSDYADTNFRYLKATGLVKNNGRGISIVPEKHLLVEKLMLVAVIPDSPRLYAIALCNGAMLPTDNKVVAKIILDDLVKQLEKRGIRFDMAGKSTETPPDIEIISDEIQAILSEKNEEEYALEQASDWEDIAAYMELIITNKYKKSIQNKDDIDLPKSERAAYFEWILWRAFLAINSLTNKPYNARRFNIDQNFLPVGTAPGGGPDMIFEFANFVIVVEVTLLDNSRQEGAEGEPVRRHVADLVSKYAMQPSKPVYGLFIANNIDSNTAETFRIGMWFTKTDEKMRLDIIPMTLLQFKNFFEVLFTSGHVDVGLIRELLDLCSALRSENEAPAWKKEIDSIVNQRIRQLSA